MDFLQVGFEITRLPKDTNLGTPMFPDKMGTNSMANTNDSRAGFRVGIGSSVFQVASSVSATHFAMASVLSGIYVIAASRLAGRIVCIPLTTSPARPMMAIAGITMGTAFAATVLPKPDNDRSDDNGATGVINSKSS